ncbi:MAG TPA: hypothetical protein VNS33_20515, partial [Bradyrhizobium sp.]|nr:hypothetical protein [Bradyrhizobium sp.]
MRDVPRDGWFHHDCFAERAMNKKIRLRGSRILQSGFWSTASAGRLAAARDADLFLQSFEPDGADHD